MFESRRLSYQQLAMAVTISDPVAEGCPMIAGQDCFRSHYSPERVGGCSTRYPCTPEYSWTFTGFSRPPFEDRIVPYPACPVLARPDYLAYTDYAYLPTPPGAVYGCVTTAATGFGSQHLNVAIPGGVASKYCCPPLHTPLPGASDNVFQPTHSSAHASHMEPCLPAYSPTRSDVTLQAAHCAGSPDQNGYRSPMYVSSGSNGLTTIGVSEVLPNNHSPVHTEPHVSYDCPKYKLTQERALPLVRWYEEHQDHPYPNRQEKLNLCQVTQLTYTQVSTWFANARRRNKKREMCQSCTSSDEGEI